MILSNATENPFHFFALRERDVVKIERDPDASLVCSLAQPSFRVARDSGAMVGARPGQDAKKIGEIFSGNVWFCFLHQTVCNAGFTEFCEDAPRFFQREPKAGTAFCPDCLER